MGWPCPFLMGSTLKFPSRTKKKAHLPLGIIKSYTQTEMGEIKLKIKNKVKSQMAGQVSPLSLFHHNEQHIQKTIHWLN